MELWIIILISLASTWIFVLLVLALILAIKLRSKKNQKKMTEQTTESPKDIEATPKDEPKPDIEVGPKNESTSLVDQVLSKTDSTQESRDTPSLSDKRNGKPQSPGKNIDSKLEALNPQKNPQLKSQIVVTTREERTRTVSQNEKGDKKTQDTSETTASASKIDR